MNNLYTHTLIPGGAHTYSKGDDQFPANAPRYLERGDGARVWDRDGTEYLDWCMGLRAVTLGYRYEPVINAAIEQIWKGSNFGRPSFIETELAEDLIALIPSAEMVKFAKNGSTVTTAAVKLARAYTGRDLVAFCKDHPFYSYDDWFIGATAVPAGVPQAIRNLSLSFRYNDLPSLERLFVDYPGQIACVILEPVTTEAPRDDFLRKVQEQCRAHGTVFILDEMITGFRYHLNGAQTAFGVRPDLATFGKGMGNGFSVAALVGRREIMELGGLHHGKPRVFLISTTHGAENHSLAAARVVIRTFREQDVIAHMWRIGDLLVRGLNEAAKDAGIERHFRAVGFPCNPTYIVADETGNSSAGLRTLFVQEMVKAGVLIPYIAPSFAHTDADVARTVDAARATMPTLVRALDIGWQRLLVGPPVKPVFREKN